jgi:adenosylcobinamide-GDP ribazoletransferase
MKNKRKMLASTAITLVVLWLLDGGGGDEDGGGGYYTGFLSLVIAGIITMIIQYASNKTLGGISGDVIGASNEVARLSSLIVLSLITL